MFTSILRKLTYSNILVFTENASDHKVMSKKFIEKNCDWKILIIIKTTGIYTLNLNN